MAERHENEDEASVDGFDRRTYLKLAGATAAAATTGFAGTAVGDPNGYDPNSVVDLGEQGLTNGDVIDPYLEEYFQDGVEVRVPEGEYEWHGGGFGANANAGVIGEGEVILHASTGGFYENIRAYGGTLVIRNLTVRGAVTSSRVRAETDDSGHILIDNWNFPDGSETDDRSRAFYVPKEHAGLVEFRNCYVRGFSDNGIYASSPGWHQQDYYSDAQGGRVVVDGCVAHNNNISGIRVGSSNSVVRNCLVINDDRSPDTGSAHNQRGIWVRGGGDDITIENCDVIHSYSGATAPINFSRAGEYSSGHIEGVRVHTDTSSDAIRNVPSAWSGNDVNVTGDGNLHVPGHFTNVCQGSDCTQPDGNYQVDDRGDGDSQDSQESSDDQATGDLVAFVSEEGSASVTYDFTAGGPVSFTTAPYDSPSGKTIEGGTWSGVDYIEQDGETWQAGGGTGEGYGDAYLVDGPVLDVTLDAPEEMWIELEGEQVTPEQLVERTAEDTASDDGSTDDGSTDDGSTDDGSETLDNRILIDGTNSPRVSSYTISVTGEIELDPSLSSTVDGGTPWDELEGNVDGGTVTDVVGMGIDGYRYSGNITGLSVDGGVEISIENNDL